MNQKRELGKRIVAWLLCMVMVLSFVNLPAFTTTVYAAGYTEGTIAGTSGTGTKSDPVVVDTFTELKAALQSSDNLYIELTGMSDTLTGLKYYELIESRDFNNAAPAIVIPAGTTKHLKISGTIDYRITALNYTHMQALIANNGGNLYVNGNGSLNVGFSGYTQDLINAVIYNRSGNVYISGNPSITTDKANIENRSLPLYNDGGYMEISGGSFDGSVNREGGGTAIALRCGSWATKTVISGGGFSAVNTVYPDSAYAMEVIGSSPVEISGGWFYKGVKTDNGKTLNDYVVSGKKTYKAEQFWEVCDPKVEEVKIKVPPLVVGKDFPVPECVSDNAYVFDYDWYYSDNRTIADGAKVQNTEYKLHVIVYTDDGKMFDWTSCTIHFNDSTGEVFLYGDTFVNTYAYFTPVEMISGSVGVTDYVAPVVGKEPVKPTKPTGVDYNVSQIWYEVPESGNQADAKTFTGAFEHGKIYCLALTFTALSGKAFDENIKVSVDGNVVEYERIQNNKIRAVLYTALNHDFSKYVSNGNGTHKVVCADCGAVQEGHDKDACVAGSDGKCTKCGAVLKGKWIKSNGKWWYRHADGTYTKNGWEKIDGKWYHFDASGYMQTGWQKISNVWYYFNASGAMQTGWQKIGGKCYYFNGSGAMQKGWQKISGKWYYFEGSGAMLTGWQEINSKWYYFDASGVMQSACWVNKIYYMDSTGAMVTSAYIKDGSKYYWVDKNGKYTKTYSEKDTKGYTIYDQTTGKKIS